MIEDIVSNAENIFKLDDLLYSLPVFSKVHAKFILEIMQDIFQDTEHSTLDILDQIDMEWFDGSEATESDNFQEYFDCTESDE